MIAAELHDHSVGVEASRLKVDEKRLFVGIGVLFVGRECSEMEFAGNSVRERAVSRGE